MLTQPGDRQYGSPSASEFFICRFYTCNQCPTSVFIYGTLLFTDNDVLCPESPATPGAVSVLSRHAATSTSTGSVEKNRVVIQESPEVHKHGNNNGYKLYLMVVLLVRYKNANNGDCI